MMNFILGTLLGFVSGVGGVFLMFCAYKAGRETTVTLELPEDFEWDHPELAHLFEGKAPIKGLKH
jgi:hypothetical protein